MRRDAREVSEGKRYQGVDEQIVYTLTTTQWGSSPTSPSVAAYDVTNNEATVTSTVLSGSASVSGDVITLPTLKSLTLGHVYRVEVQFTSGGSVFEAYFYVEAQR